jgi:HEAT repeat protein
MRAVFAFAPSAASAASVPKALVVSCALAGLFFASAPHAIARQNSADVARSVPLPPDVIKRLKSADEDQIKSALDDVRMSARAGGPAVPAIADLLERGISPALTQAALDTLGDTEAETASVALASYTRHRNVALRKAAVQALARTRGAVAARALRAALSDADPGVRGLSATALGTIKAKEAVPELFVALDHRVVEASASIGQICAAPDCDRLAAKLGSVPFDVVTAGLDYALFRSAREVDDDVKIKIVARVRELGTGQAHRFLRGVQSRWRKGDSRRVKLAIDQAVIATSGSPGAEEVAP